MSRATPPPIWAMPKRNGVFFCEVFLKTMLLIITLKTSRPIEVFRMPNPLWENSGGTHEQSIKSGHLHKIFEDPMNVKTMTDLWLLSL